MPEIVRKDILQNWQIIKAHGKAAIISLVKYLQAMGIKPIVIHDSDVGNEKAESYNKPILDAIGDESRRIMLNKCVEDVLGYKPPSNEKPYTAYSFIKNNWKEDWESINESWKSIMEQVFKDSFALSLDNISNPAELVAVSEDNH
ncbi:hypothetical protein SAMN02745176_03545 [Lutispora thermophila DSM 19022]|uniref:OLD protein-like TOPRIM domain-containing protein n=1 Tax=Lutispora thermophila DSM 19022 TaxID=1122184 RepID=A0A1M6J983_9FIRM|nr:TOPRIM nucleotidyl transferase/hydrolase domain-containing protein [Lutispora thermophila]SHJ43253.1 hypothetical protein SAMN02745176_03545 [Lutispora thermophila DSM 19022]